MKLNATIIRSNTMTVKQSVKQSVIRILLPISDIITFDFSHVFTSIKNLARLPFEALKVVYFVPWCFLSLSIALSKIAGEFASEEKSYQKDLETEMKKPLTTSKEAIINMFIGAGHLAVAIPLVAVPASLSLVSLFLFATNDVLRSNYPQTDSWKQDIPYVPSWYLHHTDSSKDTPVFNSYPSVAKLEEEYKERTKGVKVKV